MALLELENLHVALEDGTEIVKGVDLTVETGEVHAVMGPNGSGKSTLSYAIAGHPAYEITEGRILLDGADITGAGADERAQRGLFLAFQYPQAISGVRVTDFLRTAINSIRRAKAGGVENPMPVREFREELFVQMDRLKVSRELASRYLNDGFSGGEKKRVEILQMAMLKPRMAVLDETDSGLDIDALKVVAEGINALVGPSMGALLSSPTTNGSSTTSGPITSTSSSTGGSCSRAGLNSQIGWRSSDTRSGTWFRREVPARTGAEAPMSQTERTAAAPRGKGRGEERD